MSEIIEMLQSFWGLIFGAGGVVASLAFYNLNKRLKLNEVKSAEIDTLKITIDMLRGELNAVQASLIETRGLNSQLYGEKNTLEIKNSKLKSMINKAYACQYADSAHCPVLIKQRQLDAEWAVILDERTANNVPRETL